MPYFFCEKIRFGGRPREEPSYNSNNNFSSLSPLWHEGNEAQKISPLANISSQEFDNLLFQNNSNFISGTQAGGTPCGRSKEAQEDRGGSHGSTDGPGQVRSGQVPMMIFCVPRFPCATGD